MCNGNNSSESANLEFETSMNLDEYLATESPRGRTPRLSSLTPAVSTTNDNRKERHQPPPASPSPAHHHQSPSSSPSLECFFSSTRESPTRSPRHKLPKLGSGLYRDVYPNYRGDALCCSPPAKPKRSTSLDEVDLPSSPRRVMPPSRTRSSRESPRRKKTLSGDSSKLLRMESMIRKPSRTISFGKEAGEEDVQSPRKPRRTLSSDELLLTPSPGPTRRAKLRSASMKDTAHRRPPRPSSSASSGLFLVPPSPCSPSPRRSLEGLKDHQFHSQGFRVSPTEPPASPASPAIPSAPPAEASPARRLVSPVSPKTSIPTIRTRNPRRVLSNLIDDDDDDDDGLVLQQPPLSSPRQQQRPRHRAASSPTTTTRKSLLRCYLADEDRAAARPAEVARPLSPRRTRSPRVEEEPRGDCVRPASPPRRSRSPRRRLEEPYGSGARSKSDTQVRLLCKSELDRVTSVLKHQRIDDDEEDDDQRHHHHHQSEIFDRDHCLHEPESNGKMEQHVSELITKRGRDRLARLERIRERIAQEEVEAASRRKQQQQQRTVSCLSAAASCLDDFQMERCKRAYRLYYKLAMPSREKYKEKVATGRYEEVCVADIDLLPWTASGSMVNIAKIHNLLAQPRLQY